jgi:hypothetical protein
VSDAQMPSMMGSRCRTAGIWWPASLPLNMKFTTSKRLLDLNAHRYQVPIRTTQALGSTHQRRARTTYTAISQPTKTLLALIGHSPSLP